MRCLVRVIRGTYGTFWLIGRVGANGKVPAGSEVPGRAVPRCLWGSLVLCTEGTALGDVWSTPTLECWHLVIPGNSRDSWSFLGGGRESLLIPFSPFVPTVAHAQVITALTSVSPAHLSLWGTHFCRLDSVQGREGRAGTIKKFQKLKNFLNNCLFLNFIKESNTY